jgi:hypothetical protein
VRRLAAASGAFCTIALMPAVCIAQDATEITREQFSTSTLSTTGKEYVGFLSSLEWARFEFGCNQGEREDRTLFNARYSRRVRAIDHWFRKNITPTELKLIEAREEIMVGGCFRSKSGKPVMRDEARFVVQLRHAEEFRRQFAREH